SSLPTLASKEYVTFIDPLENSLSYENDSSSGVTSTHHKAPIFCAPCADNSSTLLPLVLPSTATTSSTPAASSQLSSPAMASKVIPPPPPSTS
ncbi:unnamed protein product, partial [Ilex paraguariensis]